MKTDTELKNSIESKILLRNLGFDEGFLEKISEAPSVYVIRREKIRKVHSENAVQKLDVESALFHRKHYEEEDKDLYAGMEDNFPGEEPQENFGTFYDDSNYINKETHIYEENEEHENTQPPLEQNLNIFQNCSESQMSQLNKIVKEMNSTKEEKVIVKAYRSKLKSKFYQIYEVNSENFKEKIKFKIFHKCNYPSCGRTFASAGWLRSHFQEHLKEIKKNKFNIMFENFMLNCNKNIFIN